MRLSRRRTLQLATAAALAPLADRRLRITILPTSCGYLSAFLRVAERI
jgi:hypothetical protein